MPPAGGPSDVVARIAADQMSKKLGQTLVIENVGGAGGTLGSARVASAAPDGYTLLAGSMGSHVAAPVLTPNVKYDSVRDFIPIGPTAHSPAVVVACKESGTIKAFAVSAEKRLPSLPDVPTAKELGVDYHMSIWAGMFAPKGTPAPIVKRLGDTLSTALDDPGVQQRIKNLGGSIPDKSERSPAAFDNYVKAEIAKWTPILKATAAAETK